MPWAANDPGVIAWMNAVDTQRAANATAVAALQALTVDTGWISLTLQNSWVAFGVQYGTPHYRRLNGVVYVQAAIKSGTTTGGTVVFTLPALFRPLAALPFVGPVTPLTTTWALTVNADGTCAGTGLNATVSIINLSFPAEQ
jgi:hypothetical protein